MRIVKAPCKRCYRPPKGFIVVKTVKLSDGWYEITLEAKDLSHLHTSPMQSTSTPVTLSTQRHAVVCAQPQVRPCADGLYVVDLLRCTHPVGSLAVHTQRML
jgi:hypothetical protein